MLSDEQRKAMQMPTQAELAQRHAALKANRYEPKAMFGRDPASGKIYVVTVQSKEREDEHLAGGWFLTRDEAIADKATGRPENT